MLRLAVIVGFVLVCANAVQELDGSTTCKDNPFFANCHLIVRNKFCSQNYYSRFCCKSCVEAGQLDVRELQLQADDALYKLDGSTTCKDNPFFANCHLIVRNKFCSQNYYSRFCCKSCVEAGQLDVRELQLQADDALYKLDGSTTCKDNPYFANCNLIVRSKFCSHNYYSRFCCKSCVEAGQLDVRELQLQADDALYRY